MNWNALRFVLVLAVGLTAAGCTTSVYNVTGTPMATSPAASLEDVAGAIKRAGRELGWEMIDRGPGEIEGRRRYRSSLAVVSVIFGRDAFSISYTESENLSYDAEKGRIARRYNNWVRELEKAILAGTSTI